ncbi:MAG TPA: NAD(P)H-dependent oxidoreductase [Thermoleophilia bacterium]
MSGRALVLSALGVDEVQGQATLVALEETLARRGYDAETVDCLAADVIPCTGCSSCGLKTPGACVIKDDMQGIFRTLVASDVLVLATPVRFGSYASELKKVVDRFQPLMVPIYVVRDGEMHFRGRYDLPALVGVGLVRNGAGNDGTGADGAGSNGAAAAEEADAFRCLVGRLALNIDTPHAAAVFVAGDGSAMRAELDRAVAAVAGRTS